MNKIHKMFSRKNVLVTLICILVLLNMVGEIWYVRYQRTKQISQNEIVPRNISVTGDQYRDYITDKVNIISNVEYGTAKNYKGEEESLQLDIYTPGHNQDAQDQQYPEKDRAAIVFLHGGGLTKGDKADDGLLTGLSKEYAKMGYVVFNVNYRLSESGNKEALKDAMYDVTSAVNFIQGRSDEYGFDKNTIFLSGYSSGAVISVELVYSNLDKFNLDRSSIAGVIDISGLNLQMGSPNKSNPCCLIIHGNNDKSTYKESVNLQSKLTKAGIPCDLFTLDGIMHDVSSQFNEIHKQMTEFMYQQLTGRNISLSVEPTEDPEYHKVISRSQNHMDYIVKDIPVVLDGSLDEWQGCKTIHLDQIKDVGDILPSVDNFSGNVKVAWNQETPSTMYIGATVTDNVIQSKNGANGKWYNNDCLEIAFDFSENKTVEQLVKWVVGANGQDLAVNATRDNTKVAKCQQGNTTTYEIAIDLSGIEKNMLKNHDRTTLKSGDTIGFSIAYDDSDSNTRERQIGWIAGKFSERTNMGNLLFE